MNIHKPSHSIATEINLTASKSESNRVLIIQALCNQPFEIQNLATAKDTETLKNILKSFSTNNVLDVGPAGTTFRFLTAFLSTQSGEWTLTGSERMLERPIGILVEAIRKLGGNIEYIKKEGFPPLKIKGGLEKGGELTIDGSISSQYISALLLIAPVLKGGLTLKFSSECTSKPYIRMTLEIMNYFGVSYHWKNDSIHIAEQSYSANDFYVEADWSAASYWYEIVALNPGSQIKLKGLKKESLQGDAEIADIFTNLGVKTTYNNDIVIIEHTSKISSSLQLDLQDCPDLAQTIVCTVAALGIETHLTGLKTLRIKETDRSLALQKELKKFQIQIELEGNDSIFIPGNQKMTHPLESIETYDDHRMAMAFAPLSLVTGSLQILHPEVVVKSYPQYWEDLAQAGFIL